jgi:hypothetical protein
VNRSRIVGCLLVCATLHAASLAFAKDCSQTSRGFIPLTDLGTGLYQGFPGGLYGAGSNVRPPAHEAAGLAIANGLVPLDTLGNPDPSHGRIVLISIGMSNTTMEFSTFVPLANADPARNPRVLVVDCAQGGQAADDINRSSAAYWNTVETRLRSAGSSLLQAQAVWLKEAERSPVGSFPTSAETLMRDLGTIVRIIEDKFPNVRLCYLSSRIYAGYATTNLNPEPYAYESGFAVKWLIEGQIAGADSLDFDPSAGSVEAPWLSWGPYLWADGLVPRSDGLTWDCSEFNDDGTHPATPARTKVANALLAFFKSDATATPWFLRATSDVPAATLFDLSLSPGANPARGDIEATLRAPVGSAWRLELIDAAGRRVAEMGRGVGTGGAEMRRWAAASSNGSSIREGVYWMRLTCAGHSIARRIVVLGAR